MLPLGSAYPAPGLLPSARMQRMFAKVARQSRDLLASGEFTHRGDERLVRQLVRLSLDWGGPIDAGVAQPGWLCYERRCSSPVAWRGDWFGRP